MKISILRVIEVFLQKLVDSQVVCWCVHTFCVYVCIYIVSVNCVRTSTSESRSADGGQSGVLR